MPTVLIVDDDALLRATLADILRDEGYTVLEAVNGGALAHVQDTQPDLILLDAWMPGMDGVAVSRYLRADPRTARIPIVAISAHDRVRELGMQVDDYLCKPFEFQDLLDTVAHWTHKQK